MLLYIYLKGAGLCLFCYLMMVQIVFYMYVNLAVGSVWSGGGGSVLGLQPSSLDKKITL